MRALALTLLVACGGRTEVRGTGIALDASTASDADFVACGDGGECLTSDSYCRIVTADGGTTHTCTPLPPKCHSCACAAVPKPGLTCVCTSDSDQIVVSCN